MISCLRGAGVEVIERHADVWEQRRHNWSLGLTAALRIGIAEMRLLFGGRPDRFDAVIVGYPGHFDVPAAQADRARATGDLQPARLASRDTCRGSRPVRAGLARGRRAAPCRSAGAAARRSRRCRHRAERTTARRAGRARRRAARGLLRRRGGTPLPSRLAARTGISCPLRRQADPAPRSRDNPGSRPARAGAALPRRGQRPARRADGRATAERRVGRVGRVRAAAGGDPARRLRARRLRDLARRRAG